MCVYTDPSGCTPYPSWDCGIHPVFSDNNSDRLQKESWNCLDMLCLHFGLQKVTATLKMREQNNLRILILYYLYVSSYEKVKTSVILREYNWTISLKGKQLFWSQSVLLWFSKKTSWCILIDWRNKKFVVSIFICSVHLITSRVSLEHRDSFYASFLVQYNIANASFVSQKISIEVINMAPLIL